MIRSIAFSLACLTLPATVFADNDLRDYELRITNITRTQTFTPVLTVTHRSSVSLFKPGAPASGELVALAESGNTEPLQSLLGSQPNEVLNAATSGGLLGPGESKTIEITASGHYNRLSFAAMLIPTNDTFVALDSLELPKKGNVSVTVPAYDAGSELNDELCANIPGPVCMDGDDSGEAGEGYVYVGNGIRGAGDLESAIYDWNNPVALVEIRRTR
jgi:hypothetical protein